MIQYSGSFKMGSRVSDLRKIEREAREEIKNCLGRYYDGQHEHIERLQKIIHDATIERLLLEFNGQDEKIN